MILVFGGTTEGRLAVKTLEEGEGNYFYSTLGNLQVVECTQGEHIKGDMDEDTILSFCRSHDIKLIVDAAHPFAEKLHKTLSEISVRTGIPIIRLERQYSRNSDNGVILCEDFNEAVSKLSDKGVNKLLALSGVNTISKTKAFWKNHETYFRILDREESMKKAEVEGFPKRNLVFYEKESLQDLIDKIHPEAILTKESGKTGGFDEKLEVARKNKIPLYVVKRPITPDNFIKVTGVHGLRREIEKRIPEFYPLHTGFTTGSCATAAAKAALTGLLQGEKLSKVSFQIPEGEIMTMEIDSVDIYKNSTIATVTKDAGDDPDVTNGCKILVEVAFSNQGGINFMRGKGIGTVTLPGLGLPIGYPAINKVPREMISSELNKLYEGGLNVTISIDSGEELAKKTFNPRVGVEGGLSIIGTTGIVRPFSHEAFINAIRRQFDVAKSLHYERIIINSGGKSEGFMKKIYPDLSSQSFIHYGNAIGETLSIAEEYNVPNLSMGIMLGKAVKLAEGHLDTHSHKVTFNKDFLKQIAFESGCKQESIEGIETITLARELPDVIRKTDHSKLFAKLNELCHYNCKKIYENNLHTFLFSDNGEILADFES